MERWFKRLFARKDIVFLVILLVILLVVYLISNLLLDKTGNEVLIEVNGAEFGRYDLSLDATVEITDTDGNVTNTLIIEDGYCYMSDADCPDKLCIKQGKTNSSAKAICCLPNKVIVTVTGESSNKEFDSIAQ